jgi:hypothetical protein
MIFLPIVERELRVRARQAATYRVRWIAVAMALLVAAPLLLGISRSLAGSVGKAVFTGLTLLAFGFCLFEGGRQAADSLSEEKRSGTLGLLFLTDLKSYDVVLGKLAATSLPACYGLLAVFPVFAVPVLTGGVTGGEVFRVALALVATLFLALSGGLWVSARSREEHRALWGTWLLLIAFAGGLPLLDLWMMGGNFRAIEARWSLGSPGFACAMALESMYRMAPDRFWLGLPLILLEAACLLLAASAAVVRHLRDTQHEHSSLGTPRQQGPAERAADRTGPISAAACRIAKRRRTLAANPLFWLAIRDRGLQGWLWATAGLLVALRLGQAFSPLPLKSGASGGMTLLIVSHYFGVGVQFLFWYLAATAATRCLVEARRSGALELLLSTPLKDEDYLRGQWMAVWRQLLGPVALLAIANSLLMPPPIIGQLHPGLPHEFPVVLVAFLGANALVMLVEVGAVGWVGMWMALSSKQPSHAVAKTFLLVVLLPSLLCSGFPIYAPASRMMPWISLFGMTHPLVLMLKDLLFMLWARRRTRGQFREMAVAQLSSTPPPRRQASSDLNEDFALLESPKP